MSVRAVVLGGGGLTGVAWLTGVISALEDAGVAIADADLIVGTSAGSIAATHLAAGRDFGTLYHYLADDRVPARDALMRLYGTMPSPDPEVLAQLEEQWRTAPRTTRETSIAAGTAALAAHTMPEPIWVALVAAFVRSRHWPSATLAITAVDAEDGSLRVFRDTDQVHTARAVAASAAVPRMFPPVRIGDRRYVDGGVRSTTNADLAAGHDTVLLFVDHQVVEDGEGTLSRASIERELAELRAGGAEVIEVALDAASTQAMGGLESMDPDRMAATAKAGRAQGEAEAARIAAAWPPRA
jgi:NTE family protein